jgi:predicted metal-dependent phosphoesterase TrpH
MIDLHTHTINSDGSDTTLELLKKAETLGIKYFSITDHDNVNAYKEIDKINLEDYYAGNLITGIEIYTHYQGEIIEILGYNFDVSKLDERLQKHQISKQYINKYNNRYKILKNEYLKKGIKFDYSLYNENNELNNKVIYNEIIKYEENDKFFLNIKNKKHRSLFFRNEVNNPNSNFYVDQTTLYPSLEVVLKIIHESGGITFLAHPYVYSKNIINKLENIINNYDIDGLECFYTTFSDKEVETLLNLCDKYNLYVSGGSDYHGINKKDHNIGKFYKDNEKVYKYVKKWL